MSFIALRELAYGRAGDKGNRLNISVIAKDERDYAHLVANVTEKFCADVFKAQQPTCITRYLLPHISALNIVLEDALGGGVNSSLAKDRHGKTLSALLFDATIAAPLSR